MYFKAAILLHFLLSLCNLCRNKTISYWLFIAHLLFIIHLIKFTTSHFKAVFLSFSDFDELFRDIAEVREAVKKELARNFNSNKNDVFIGEDEEELVHIHANSYNVLLHKPLSLCTLQFWNLNFFLRLLRTTKVMTTKKAV